MSRSTWGQLLTHACLTFAICFAVNGWWARELLRVGARPLSPSGVSATPLSSQTRQLVENSIRVQRHKLHAIANNISNADTPAYKRDVVLLTGETYTEHYLPDAAKNDGGDSVLLGGNGVAISAIHADFRQGAFAMTQRELDLAIEGKGFFVVADPITGEFCYTRMGGLSIDADGVLGVKINGTTYTLDAPIRIPETATSVLIQPDGSVTYVEVSGGAMAAGDIQLATFINPEGLRKMNGGLFFETDESGCSQLHSPGLYGCGLPRQVCLEASNVDKNLEQLEFDHTGLQIANLEALLTR